MKFSIGQGITTIRGYQMGSKKCYVNSLRKSEPQSVNMVLMDTEMLDTPEEGPTTE